MSAVGAVGVSISFLLSSFAPSLESLVLLYGVLFGASFAGVYLPTVSLVSAWFSKCVPPLSFRPHTATHGVSWLC